MKTANFLLLCSTQTLFGLNCLGPEDSIANAPFYSQACEENWSFKVIGIYWSANEDGLEYAIDSPVSVPVINPTTEEIQRLNNFIDARYETPRSKWEFGFKLGLGHTIFCDDWDLQLLWTSYKNCATKSVDTKENTSLLPLFSAFSPSQGSVLYARDISSTWKLNLQMIDLELGRTFWTSKRLSICPYIGLRYAKIKQDLDLEHMGGSWSPRTSPAQDPLINNVNLDNQFNGTGIRSGLDSIWHGHCGFGLYANASISLLYGRFHLRYKEKNRLAIPPATQESILETADRFRASRAILDLALGVEWSSLIYQCKYTITSRFGWEHHLFFHQNQLWRINRTGNSQTSGGENVFTQKRGSLSTKGWTLSFDFGF